MPDSAAWTLYGITPADKSFALAGEDTHRAFWRFVAQRGVERFRWRCNQGLDNQGRQIASYAPLAASTVRKGRWRSHTGQGSATNPPLSPALGRSRTEDLIRGRGFADHAEWFWATDEVTGLHWGQVLLWHAQGRGHLPVRNVIGWSSADIAWLRSEGQTWWYAVQHGQRVAAAAETLKFPATISPGAVPAKIVATGRTDIEYATFGIGGTRERTAGALEEGYHTGFRRLGPRKPPPGRAAPARPAPSSPPPSTVPMVAPTPIRRRPAAVAKPAVPAAFPSLPAAHGVTFAPSYRAQSGYDIVTVDLVNLHADLARDVPSYVGPGGIGQAKPGSYEGFERFLANAREKGAPIEMPEVSLTATGDPVVIDGRHRLAVFLAQGARFLPVAVPIASSKAFRQKYGQLAF